MSKFYNTSLDKVPNSGSSVRLTIGTDGATTNEAFQTTSTPCKKVWMMPSAGGDIRLKIGEACAATTGVSLANVTKPFPLEIDDINKLFFYGETGATIDILYRE